MRDVIEAARKVFEQDARQHGGYVSDAECRICGKRIVGHVMLDAGEQQSWSGPYVPPMLYVAGYVRDCNCNTMQSDIERDLIVGVAQEAA